MTLRRTTFCSAALVGGLLLDAGGAGADSKDPGTTVQIDNVKTAPRDAKTATVSFDLSWENSWRHERNHDALWIIVKVKPAGQTAWQHLAWDGEAVCIGAVVTDDTHFNSKAGGELWNGDAIQFGPVNPKGVHFNAAPALTTNGVAMHPFMGEGDAVVKTAEKSVTRNDAAKLTRYGLRIPLASVGLKPGDELAFNIMITDGDDETGMRHNLQLAPGIAYPFRTELCPRFVLKK